MKRSSKITFFVVAALILGLAYTAIFGVYTNYGDRRDTVIRGMQDIRFGIDIRGGIDVTFGPTDDVKSVTDAQMEAAKEIISSRLIGSNITDYELYTDTDNMQIIVRFPWQSGESDFDATAAINELGQTAQLEFRIGSETKEVKDEDGNVTNVPAGDLVLTGDDVESAAAMYQTDESGNNAEPVVQLQLKESGRDKFAQATTTQAANKGTISIWLDNQLISDPTVNDAITNGEAVITGNFTYDQAATLANQINSGALPFALEVKSSGTITPTLGEQALTAMLIAGAIALVIISIFMIVYYRLPGLVAVIALIGQVAGSLAVVSGYFGFLNSFTLTLPGIAGIILSIGMGVDANIITAERIKEEIQLGKTIDGAIYTGSKNSFWAIFDGNITVIIVSIVLMGVFGPPDGFFATILKPLLFYFPASTTGSIYSFGYTLLAGIIFNFVMGVTMSRLMLRSISRFKCMRKPWLYGGKRA